MNWEKSGPLAGVPVEPTEKLSHYLFRKELRVDDTVKPEAVMPYPHEDLSATRHRELSENDIWNCGLVVASKQNRTLFGRADFIAAETPAGLILRSTEPPRNHADIGGWPSERSAQLRQAVLLSGHCKGLRLKSQVK